MFKKTIDFLLRGVWQIKVASLPPMEAFWIRSLRFLLLILRGFARKELQEKASILAYYTLISIVPLFAIFLAISRGFFLEDAFIQLFVKRFKAEEAVLMQFINFAKHALEIASRGVITGLGLLLFLWSTFKILNHLERALNVVFDVKDERSLARRVSDYLAVIVLSPLFLTVSAGITLYLSTKVPQVQGHFHVMGFALYLGLNIISYFLISFLFTFLYLFLPNRQVNFFSAFWGGIIAGLIYQLFQLGYMYFQIFVSKQNALLGTLAAIPLFLVWLQMSWLILLLGAKITFSFQGIDSYEFIIENFSLNHKTKKLLALMISQFTIKEFCLSRPPPTILVICEKLSIPLFLTKSILDELVTANILSQVRRLQSDMFGYHPAIDVEQLTIKRVLDMIDENGDEVPLPRTSEVKALSHSLNTFNDLIERSKANVLLKDI